MKNLYSLAVAQLTVGGAGSKAGVTPVGEEDMEWLKENLTLEQLNAAISSLGTEEVRERVFLFVFRVFGRPTGEGTTVFRFCAVDFVEKRNR